MVFQLVSMLFHHLVVPPVPAEFIDESPTNDTITTLCFSLGFLPNNNGILERSMLDGVVGCVNLV